MIYLLYRRRSSARGRGVLGVLDEARPARAVARDAARVALDHFVDPVLVAPAASTAFAVPTPAVLHARVVLGLRRGLLAAPRNPADISGGRSRTASLHGVSKSLTPPPAIND